MNNANYVAVYGVIQDIRMFGNECCQQIVSILTDNGVVNFIISPNTYVVNERRLRRGMNVAAFYDANLPVPLIYPPQYQAVIITERRPRENVMVDYFNNSLEAVNNSLKLNVGRGTDVVTPNGQRFTCNLRNRLLIVFYGATTRIIPPQTTPDRIIVMC